MPLQGCCVRKEGREPGPQAFHEAAALARRWRVNLWRKRKKNELDMEEEVRGHLEMAARERVERGERADDAERAARREFGNVELVKETVRDNWGQRWAQ